MVSVATSLANDGIASPVASLDHDGRRGSYGVHIPIAVVVDLDFVENGPDRQTQAGIGDAVSNLNAVADWELAHRVRGEPIDGLAVTLARIGRRGGAQPPRHDRRRRLPHHAGRGADHGRARDGGVRLVAGRPAAAATRSRTPSTCSPGRRLARRAGRRSARCSARSCAATGRGSRQLARCLRRHGLPGCPADLGLTDERVRRARCAYAPRTRPDRYTILEHLDLSPAEIARAAGRLRRCGRRLITLTRRRPAAARLLRAPTGAAACSARRSASGSARRSRSSAHRLGPDARPR